MTDWATIASFATAGGTLVLALSTFSAVRSANRTARIAEETLLTGMRPLLVPSLSDDPVHKVLWSDRHTAKLGGGRAIFECEDGVIYFAIGLRNLGTGIALLHGWHPYPDQAFGSAPHLEPEEFRRLSIDLYIPAGGTGYWEAAIRDADDSVRPAFQRDLDERRPFTIDLLYGDQLGGQRTISRYTVLPAGEEGWFGQVARHWHIDRPDPR
jgi:hypothetical protein